MKQILNKTLFLTLVLVLLLSCAVTASADTIDVTDFTIDNSAPDKTVVTWNESADAVLKNEAQAGYPAAMTIDCKFGSAYALYVSDAAGAAVNRVMPSSIEEGKITFEIPGAGVYHILQGSAPVTTYTVTFNANGHGTAPAPQTGIFSGGKAAEPTVPTADGYTFGGWYREAACTTAWNFSTDTVTGDITLYAKWTAIGDITITPSTAEVWQGSTQQFASNVSGVTWTVTGAADASTAIDANGKLTVGTGETADLTVTAALGGRSDSVTVDVKQNYSVSSISWIRNSGKDASTVVQAPKAELEAVYVDGKLVSGSSYTLSGTDKTTITFKNSYLRTLSTGKHTLELTYADGKAEAQLTVKKATASANTGDQFNLILWIILMIACLAAAVTLLILAKKRKK